MDLNKIYCESCLETMQRMPDGFIDLTVTSPPYDDLRVYNGYSFPFEDIAKELFRVIKTGGVVVWVVGDATKNGSETGTSFKQALYFISIGFNLHDTMIYAKQNPIPLTHNRYEQAFEYMFIFSKGRPSAFNPIMENCKNFGGYNHMRKTARTSEASTRVRDEKSFYKQEKQKDNIWYYSIGTDNDRHLHPAPYPEQLARDHIYSWSKEGDLVYDPFGGSGTTAKMAHLQQRNWILSEISSEYAAIAQKRIEPYLRQLRMEI